MEDSAQKNIREHAGSLLALLSSIVFIDHMGPRFQKSTGLFRYQMKVQVLQKPETLKCSEHFCENLVLGVLAPLPLPIQNSPLCQSAFSPYL